MYDDRYTREARERQREFFRAFSRDFFRDLVRAPRTRSGKVIFAYFILVQLWTAGEITVGLLRPNPPVHEPHASAPAAVLKSGRRLQHYDGLRARAVLLLWAEAGDPQAQYLLGTVYESGRKPYDICEATRWYDKAARQGHAGAQGRLAEAYIEGTGVLPDDERAYRWALAASRHGGKRPTLHPVSWFAERVTAAERKMIEAEMVNWRPEDEPPARIIRILDLPGSVMIGISGIRPCRNWFDWLF